ncbi:YeeE/YedE family protein [Neptunicella sp. SCSIO 80796]|uniref:YeeE/YedE family protein n=1 Tax=Neptunicella plasticusilytica TaxID=3117012 RepID=UPI003A4DB808
MDNFTPVSALFGGALIGLSAWLLWWLIGRIAGISGIVSGINVSLSSETRWRLLFVGGLILGCFLAVQFGAQRPQAPSGSTTLLIIAGLLVGTGTVIGSGCTSGHGVCGISRFSKRSISATLIFMAVAMLTVWLMRA